MISSLLLRVILRIIHMNKIYWRMYTVVGVKQKMSWQKNMLQTVGLPYIIMLFFRPSIAFSNVYVYLTQTFVSLSFCFLCECTCLCPCYKMDDKCLLYGMKRVGKTLMFHKVSVYVATCNKISAENVFTYANWKYD